jgi:hypothetical protein
MITSNAEAHPDKIAEHYASLVAEPDAGWVELASHARRYLYGERIEAGTAVALAWCKHCQAMTNALPHDMPDLVNFGCSSCGHGVKHARVVPNADVERVRAEMTALTPKQLSKMPEEARRASSLDERRDVYAKTLEEWRDRDGPPPNRDPRRSTAPPQSAR